MFTSEIVLYEPDLRINEALMTEQGQYNTDTKGEEMHLCLLRLAKISNNNLLLLRYLSRS